MALLKKVKSSTLVETLVATVLIVVIFMISSMVLNNFMSGNIRQNTEWAEERLHVLEYQYKNDALKLPYYEHFEAWQITVSSKNIDGIPVVNLEAENPQTHKIVTQFIIDEN